MKGLELFARGAASRRLKEADRRLYGGQPYTPKEAGRTEAPGQVSGGKVAPQSDLDAAATRAQSGNRQDGGKG